jgi:tellurite resistance protein TerC
VDLLGGCRTDRRAPRARPGPRRGGGYGTQYFAGYLVEKSLSIDNLFVFVVIMSTFVVPDRHQHKVLTFGIIIALILRAIFIALGAALLELFSSMFLVFGVPLILTAIQLFRHRNEDPDVQDDALVRLTRRVLPVTTEYDGGRLFTRLDGRRVAIPLFIVLVAIGSTDIRDPDAVAHAGSLRATEPERSPDTR